MKSRSSSCSWSACSFFFSSRRRHTRCSRDWSSDVCSSDLISCADPQRIRQRRVEKCLQLLNDCQQNILLKMRLQRPFLQASNTKHISPGFWSCNAKHIERQRKRKLPSC